MKNSNAHHALFDLLGLGILERAQRAEVASLAAGTWNLYAADGRRLATVVATTDELRLFGIAVPRYELGVAA